ncbi:MAG: hypothetical protein ACR2GN_09560 [Bacteroidia bacterium]
MEKLKKFNYKKLIAKWDTFDKKTRRRNSSGEPSDKLIKHAQEMADLILYNTGLGMGLYDMGDLNWHDRLWYIHDDDELFERVQEIVAELIEELGGSAKEKRAFIKQVYDMELENSSHTRGPEGR